METTAPSRQLLSITEAPVIQPPTLTLTRTKSGRPKKSANCIDSHGDNGDDTDDSDEESEGDEESEDEEENDGVDDDDDSSLNWTIQEALLW